MKTVTEHQQKAIEAIAAQRGATMSERRQAAGLRPGTLRNWRRQPAFEAALREAMVRALQADAAEAGKAYARMLERVIARRR